MLTRKNLLAHFLMDVTAMGEGFAVILEERKERQKMVLIISSPVRFCCYHNVGAIHSELFL